MDNNATAAQSLSFAAPIRNFADSLSALREFVDMVGGLLSEKVKGVYAQHTDALVPLGVLMSTIDPASVEHSPFSNDANQFDGTIKVEKVKNGFSLTLSGEGIQPFVDALKSVRRSHSHIGLLYRNSLVSLIASAEWVLAQLIRLYYETHPAAIGLENKRLSYDDIVTLGSMEEAKHHLVDLKIEEVMHGSFEDWLTFFQSQLKLKMGYLDPMKDELTEIFQRRHLVVHNNGIVNSTYLKKVPRGLTSKVELGTVLEVSSTYLQKAIDTIELAFLLIGAELWKHLRPDDKLRHKELLSLAFERLTSERWEVAKGLSGFLMRDKHATEEERLVCRCNFWQCQKWLGDFETARKEIEEADFSANDERFQIAKFTLLDDYDAFFSLLPKVMAQEKLTQQSLESWPLFREVRKSQQYKEFKKAFIPDPQSDTDPSLIN